MKTTTIHIRNMCCQRCIDAVTDELRKLDLNITSVKLGEASFKYKEDSKLHAVEAALNKRGFILFKEEGEIVVEQIKASILELVNRLGDIDRKDFSIPLFLEEKTKRPYRYLLELFKKQKRMTIEKYFILQKVEKVKDLLENSHMQLSEIADCLGYKSLQHLSNQFKNRTGVNMKQYKKTDKKRRIFIDRI